MGSFVHSYRHSVMLLALSKLDISSISSTAKSLSKSHNVIQIFDPSKIINRIHLDAAYLNAVEAFEEHTNSSNSLSTEMLLFAAFTSQITIAIDKVGAKDNMNFLLFCSNISAFKQLSNTMPITKIKEFRHSPEQMHKIARTFKIFAKDLKGIDYAIMQRMALSKLE